MRTIFLILPLLALIPVGCGDDVDKEMLHGSWRGVEWVVEGHDATYDATLASFTFNADGTYAYTYSDAAEKGEYYVTNRELYTTPEGGVKMMVRIRKLTTDSLVFDMNRGGMAERLTLIRP